MFKFYIYVYRYVNLLCIRYVLILNWLCNCLIGLYYVLGRFDGDGLIYLIFLEYFEWVELGGFGEVY